MINHGILGITPENLLNAAYQLGFNHDNINSGMHELVVSGYLNHDNNNIITINNI